MKNIKILLWIYLGFVSLFAQDKDIKDLYTDFTTAINSVLLTKQGAIEVSGFLSYNYQNTDYKADYKISSTTIQAEPAFSYFFVDNISAGMLTSYAYHKTERSGTALNRAEQTFIGPIVKMYFGDEKIRPFIFTDYLFLIGDIDSGELDFGAGLFYHVTGNFGLNLFSKYGIIWPEENYIDSQQRIFVGFGISNFIL